MYKKRGNLNMSYIDLKLDYALISYLKLKLEKLEDENKFLRHALERNGACSFNRYSQKDEPLTCEYKNEELKLAGFCEVQEHNHELHVIGKTNLDNGVNFSYFISKQTLKDQPPELLLELHKQLIQEIMEKKGNFIK
jgi:hypothetical protein